MPWVKILRCVSYALWDVVGGVVVVVDVVVDVVVVSLGIFLPKRQCNSVRLA